MALAFQNVPIDFGQGLDTKTDPKRVLPGNFLRLENAVFTKAKRIMKRNGYDSITTAILGGGSLVSPQAVKAYGEELVCADSGKLYSFSEDLNCWIPKGKYQSIAVSDFYISRSAYSQSFSSAALAGNLALYSWTANGNAYAKVIDTNTNTVVLQDTSLGGTSSVTRSCLLGSSTLGVFFTDTSGNLYLSILAASSSGISFGNPITIATNLVADGALARFPFYDVATTSGGAVVVWAKGSSYSGTPSGMSAVTVNTSGSTVNSATIDSSGRDALIRAFVASNGNIWFYWVDDTTASSCPLYYSIWSSSLSSVLSRTQISSGVPTPGAITVFKTSNTSQTVYYQQSSTLGTYQIYSASCSSGGSVGTPTKILAGVQIASDPFTVGSFNYMSVGFVSQSNTQSTLFVVDLADRGVVAKAFSNQWALNYPPTTPIAVSSTKIQIPTPFTDQIDVTAGVFITSEQGSAAAVLDFANQNAFQGIAAGGIQVWNGGIITMYDGDSSVELGFNLFPEEVAVSGLSSGSTYAYQYFAVYRWYDAQGNAHLSAPSPVVTATSSAAIGSGNQASVAVNTLYLTQKTNSNNPVQILLYRTTNGGSVPYLVTSVTSPTVNNPLSDSVTITDAVSDSTLTTNEPIYSNSLIPGGVIENIAPPPAMLMALRNNRLNLVSSETDEIWPSKSIAPGMGLSFSDLLAYQVDERGGDISAIQEMDSNLVIFKSSIPFIQAGDAADDTGNNSTLTNPQVIPSDAGCSAAKTVVLLPGGILRQTEKGFYLLGRNLQDQYIGMAVEGYNSQVFTAATLLKSVSQVRFLTSSGLTLVYDYIFNQWSTFTNHQGYGADLWNGTYVYARTDGSIYEEDQSGSYLDNTTAYAVLLQTAWLALASVQGFQRVRLIEILGDFINGSSANHGLQITPSYDFGTGSVVSGAAVSKLFGAASASGAIQYQQFFATQKCDALQLLIQEVTTGASGEFVDLTNMELVVGIKQGLNKLAATQKVG